MVRNSVPESPSGTHSLRTRSVLILIACCALAAGLGEAALRFALLPFRELLGNRIHLNPQMVWMGPLANAVLFTPPTLLAYYTLRRFRGGTLAYPAAVTVAVFLAAFSVAMITRRLSDWALAALALGAAVQVARFSRARPVVALRLARRSTLALLVVCLGGTVVVNAAPAWRERSMRAALPDATAGAPNVLLLVLDTVRGGEMGVYGYPLATTPNVDRWATRGIVFDRAFATAPWTLPSHASLFTGKWAHETGTGWLVPMPQGRLTIARRLGALGYVTGGFAANTVYASWLFGLQDGFSRYRDYHRSPSEVIGASSLGRWAIVRWNRWRGDYVMVGRVSAREVNGSFDRWQRGIETGRPWFAFINYFDAHDPYDPQEPYRTRFPGTVEKWRSLAALRQRPPEELRALQAAYDGAIASLDEEVGRLLDDLERRGILENTIVVITSDHGEEFGEHGVTGHGTSQYANVLHVPLIVITPDSAAVGARIRRFVSLRDVPATIEDLVTATARELPGHSLRPLWSGDTLAPISPVFSDVQRLATLPARYPTSKHNIQSLIVEDRWHLIRPEGGAAELYDLATDSLEAHNLAGDPAHGIRLRAMMDSVTRLRGR
jgi:arylsulfatase A-like enzyme